MQGWGVVSPVDFCHLQGVGKLGWRLGWRLAGQSGGQEAVWRPAALSGERP